MRIIRRDNEALDAALRDAGFTGTPENVAALVALAVEVQKRGIKVAVEGTEKPAESAQQPVKPVEPKATENAEARTGDDGLEARDCARERCAEDRADDAEAVHSGPGSEADDGEGRREHCG